MTILTPELASQMLDKLGPPRHFVPLNESPTSHELLRLLRSRLSSRVRWVALHTGLTTDTVRRVMRSLFATKPSEPEGMDE